MTLTTNIVNCLGNILKGLRLKKSGFGFFNLFVLCFLILIAFYNVDCMKIKSKTKNKEKTSLNKAALKIKSKAANKNKLKNSFQRGLGDVFVDQAVIHISPSPQVAALGPYGMHGDLSRPYRYYKGRLVHDDPYFVDPNYLRVRDRIFKDHLRVKSAAPLEVGDFEGNWIRADRGPPLMNRYGYLDDPYYHGNDAVLA